MASFFFNDSATTEIYTEENPLSLRDALPICPQGETGPAGADGAAGPQGPQGEQGPAGAEGGGAHV